MECMFRLFEECYTILQTKSTHIRVYTDLCIEVYNTYTASSGFENKKQMVNNSFDYFSVSIVDVSIV